MIGYVLLMVLGTIFLGSVIPLLQFIRFKRTHIKKKTKYYFTEQLLNYDLDNLRFENVDVVDSKYNNRLYIADRGWVRRPNGTVLSGNSFEKKKELEYQIKLP